MGYYNPEKTEFNTGVAFCSFSENILLHFFQEPTSIAA